MKLYLFLLFNAAVLVASIECASASIASQLTKPAVESRVRRLENDTATKHLRATTEKDDEDRMAPTTVMSSLKKIDSKELVPWIEKEGKVASMKANAVQSLRSILKKPQQFTTFIDTESPYDITFRKWGLDKTIIRDDKKFFDNDVKSLFTHQQFRAWFFGVHSHDAGSRHPKIQKLATLVKHFGTVKTARMIESAKKNIRDPQEKALELEKTQFGVWDRDIGDPYKVAFKIFGISHRKAMNDEVIQAILNQYELFRQIKKKKPPKELQPALLKAFDNIDFS